MSKQFLIPGRGYLNNTNRVIQYLVPAAGYMNDGGVASYTDNISASITLGAPLTNSMIANDNTTSDVTVADSAIGNLTYSDSLDPQDVVLADDLILGLVYEDVILEIVTPGDSMATQATVTVPFEEMVNLNGIETKFITGSAIYCEADFGGAGYGNNGSEGYYVTIPDVDGSSQIVLLPGIGLVKRTLFTGSRSTITNLVGSSKRATSFNGRI